MILWLDGGHGARENMRRDAALLEAAAAGRLEAPVLRLFQFRPAGITLGRSQQPGRELDLARVEAAGLEWARRPTGGRAIYHGEEWTFSLVTALGAGEWALDAASAYAATCALMQRALRSMGVPVECSPGSARGVGSPRAAEGAAAPCFASTARHELTIDGRKFAGIAQRQVRSALLQQGSLLLGDSHLELARWLALPEPARVQARDALEASAVSAGGWLAADTPLERLADALEPLLPKVRRLQGSAALATLGLGASA